ncbi:DUF5398 family protein [Candidatus Protochlamydia phocaeensis]|uniref:DUF5398 family protein n=1 Tax=Candidatus Protochlamydia phocaeensis TaxID=1414722 RepID=UPI000838FF4B|nr:DUF5398 family protein [Candidatus Protochlamydia phocaeensis]
MFGLESQKKKKPIEEFVFDLEKMLVNPEEHKKLREKIENRIQEVKKYLRSGENQEEFDRLGMLLHGYTSLLKVMSRFSSKK